MMMKAQDIMTQDVVKIKGSAKIAEAVQLMREKHIRCLIVDRRRDGDAYGIITETDIVNKVTAYGKDPQKVRVFEVMTKPCIVINPDLGVEYVARLFAQTKIHHAPVIRGELLGLVSTSDILHKGDFVENPKENFLEKEIQEAITQARQVCAEKGATSKECAVAWDIVEELQAEAAHHKAEKPPKTAFEEYLEENPEAAEARMYEL
ncbi:MAG: CP12 domain-containing protein [Halothece sp. Uz-M2-17]|nr:CP12 domain-containing protein [Halothece sp. Uz-M2-17]